MKNRNIIIAVLILLLISTGCIGVNQKFKELRNNVFSMLDETPHLEIEVGLGSAGLAFASSIVRFAEEDKMPADIMSLLKSVQIGVYETSAKDYALSRTGYKSFISQMDEDGWTPIVKIRDDYETSMVFVRKDVSEGIKEIIFINRNGNELVIGEVKGNLERIVATIIKNKSFHVEV